MGEGNHSTSLLFLKHLDSILATAPNPCFLVYGYIYRTYFESVELMVVRKALTHMSLLSTAKSCADNFGLVCSARCVELCVVGAKGVNVPSRATWPESA